MPTVDEANCPDPSVHGNPFRYCPYCRWIEPPTSAPVPPSTATEPEEDTVSETAAAGSEVREEWGVRWGDGSEQLMPEAEARSIAAWRNWNATLIRRTTTPWEVAE